MLARPASADKRSSCYDGPPLVAANVSYHLRAYSASMDFWDGKSPLPKTTYGRCKVREATLFDPRGRRLAKLHCGMTVERKGLTDHLGLEVGALGKQVLERSRPQKHETFSCTSYTGGSRCWYQSSRGHEPRTSYILRRKLKRSVALKGADAERFFRGQRIAKIFVTGNCH